MNDAVIYVSKADDIRGKILDRMVVLERSIDVYLSRYFTNSEEKKHEIMNLLFCTERIMIGGKMQIFDYIVKNKEADFLLKNKSFLKDIYDVIEHRNIFAHYMLDVRQEVYTKWQEKIVFVKFKNTTTSVEYSDQRINQILQKIKKSGALVQELTNERFINNQTPSE